jgi:hypothetical protein
LPEVNRSRGPASEVNERIDRALAEKMKILAMDTETGKALADRWADPLLKARKDDGARYRVERTGLHRGLSDARQPPQQGEAQRAESERRISGHAQLVPFRPHQVGSGTDLRCRIEYARKRTLVHRTE